MVKRRAHRQPTKHLLFGYIADYPRILFHRAQHPFPTAVLCASDERSCNYDPPALSQSGRTGNGCGPRSVSIRASPRISDAS